MQNILIGIKRFLKNKNTVTIFAILLSVGILFFAYDYRIKKDTEPVSVPYATRSIAPRTLITKDMISTRSVPGGVVKNSKVLMSVQNIVGKYVNNTAVIPEGGLFYEDMVVDWENIPSSLYADIPDGYTIFLLGVNMETTYGNSIFPGNYIDLYYRGNDDQKHNNKLIYSKFIESIRVLAVVDSNGNNVFETDGNPLNPNYLVFSVPDDIYVLLLKAGQTHLIPVQRNYKYSENPKPTQIYPDNSRIQELIEDNSISDEILYQNRGFSNNTNTSNTKTETKTETNTETNTETDTSTEEDDINSLGGE